MAEFRWKPEFREGMDSAIDEGMNAYLLVVSSALREQLSQAGAGKLYRRSQRAAPKSAVKALLGAFRRMAGALGRKARGKRPNARAAGWHRASAAGQPPAADTGTLRRSWQVGSGGRAVVRRSADAGVRRIRLGSALRYARIERGWGRVKPRPYVRPTVDAVRDLFEVTMARAIARVTGRGE